MRVRRPGRGLEPLAGARRPRGPQPRPARRRAVAALRSALGGIGRRRPVPAEPARGRAAAALRERRSLRARPGARRPGRPSRTSSAAPRGAPASARRASSRSTARVKAVVVHHTVSLNDYTPAEAPAIVLAICRYHRNSNGWNDIGYNALVDKYGVLYEGRAGGLDRAVVGAQAQGFNSETAGIASIADHTSSRRRRRRSTAMARYIRWKLGGAPAAAVGQGHADERGRVGEPLRRGRSRDGRPRARPPRRRAHGLPRATCSIRSSTSCARWWRPASAPRRASPRTLSAALAHYSIDYGEPVPVTGLLSGPGRAARCPARPSRCRPTRTGAGSPPST